MYDDDYQVKFGLTSMQAFLFAPFRASADSGVVSSSFSALYSLPSRQSAPTTRVIPLTSVDFSTWPSGMPRALATAWASPSSSALG